MNQEELNQLISRSRESLRDWINLKDENPSKASYCDLQIGYELKRFNDLQMKLVAKIELENCDQSS